MLTIIVVEHRSFDVNTGGTIPVLVRAEFVFGPPPVVEEEPWGRVNVLDAVPPIPDGTSCG